MLPCALADEDRMTSSAAPHQPVLLRETLAWLEPRPGAVIVDCTVGAGGHSEALLDASAPNGRVIGVDRDPAALLVATRRLDRFGDRFLALHGDYRELPALLHPVGVLEVDAVLADLGISSMQLGDPGRGFSFQADGPLDMRLDPGSGGPTAADLLADLPEAELQRILRDYGEESLAGRIARAIGGQRQRQPLRRTGDLASLVERVAGPAARRLRIHPATRTFQALRIAVNQEVQGLDRFVVTAASSLRQGGRMAVIAFHSLEDRAIKHAMRGLAERCICPPGLPVCGCGRDDILRVLTPRPIRPSQTEIDANPRARSARLRVAQRLG